MFSRLARPEVLIFISVAAFFLLIFLFYPFRARFEFDPDEGINAIKALMLARGFPLYSQIWSDQPPVFTYLLAITLRLTRFDINIARTFVLILSSILLLSAALFVRLSWSTLHALFAVLLIALLPFYASLSVSVMIGLPALTFAMLSLLALGAWHTSRRNFWLFISALALGLSAFTKIFTLFLVPIFLLGILMDYQPASNQKHIWRSRLTPAFLWGVSFTALSLLVSLIFIGPAYLPELFNTHLAARTVELYESLGKTLSITAYIRPSWPFVLLAFCGSVFAIIQKKWLTFYLLAWSATAYLLLAFHTPVWYHHQLLVTVPLAMLAAIGIAEAVLTLLRNRSLHSLIQWETLIALVSIAGFVLILVARVPPIYYNFRLPAYLIEPVAKPAGHEEEILSNLRQYAANSNWIFTDVPMYAFRVGLPIPPPLAVISEKRLTTGTLSEDDIIKYVDEYQPAEILLGRFKFQKLSDHLRNDYRTIYSWGKSHFYLLRSVYRGS